MRTLKATSQPGRGFQSLLRSASIAAIAFIGLSPIALAESERNDPIANPASVVVETSARFTILTNQLVRMEWSDSGIFEERASLTFINRNLQKPEYTVRRNDEWLHIETDALSIRFRRDARSFSEDTLFVTFQNDGADVTWVPGLPDNQNLLGTTRTVDGFEGAIHYRDGGALQLEDGLVSRSGWVLIDDSASLLFEGDPERNVLGERQRDTTDWYLFAHGQNYKAALGDFTKVAGKIPMPPRFAFGYWWSRYWAYSDSELRDLVRDMQSYNIPLDVLVIDMDWHETYGLTSKNPASTPFNGMLGWTGYSWNKSLFPEPETFLDWTERTGLKVALNLHPSDGIAPMEEHYSDMAGALDHDTSLHDGWIEYRMSDSEWARAFFEYILRPHEKIGVDFWWLDWQQWPVSRFVENLNNTFWLNHTFFNDMKQRYPEKRPLLFHRWGGLGNHRYQVGFSGDAVISWKSLAFQPYFTATAANVGYGYWSHDIGGHIDADDETAKDSELYLRWIQFGALSPILRTHSSKNAVTERRIWKHTDYFLEMRSAIQRRYQLFPYFYRAARIAHDSGVSIIRPMYYDYPGHDQAYEVPGQFMLGDDAIVAPIATPINAKNKLASQSIWLPEGKWYEWDTGTLLEGGQTVHRLFAVDETPIYFKAGTIIPMLPGDVQNLSNPPNSIVFTFVPGGDRATRFYEDDGVSQSYLDKEFAWTNVSSKRRDNELIVTIERTEGAHDSMARSKAWRLDLENVERPTRVIVAGHSLSDSALAYNASTLTASISLPQSSILEQLEIRVCFEQNIDEAAQRLNGKKGQFRRLRNLAPRIKAMSARTDWAATLPNQLLALIETPQRIQYNREAWAHEINSFDTGLAKLSDLISQTRGISQGEALVLASHLSFDAGEKEER